MTDTTQTLTDRSLRSGRAHTLVEAVTAAAARIRTRRRATDEAVQPVPFDPEHHLMHPFAVLVTGLR